MMVGSRADVLPAAELRKHVKSFKRPEFPGSKAGHS